VLERAGCCQKIDDNLRALVDYGDGIDREVIIGVSDEDIKVGGLVIVHAGVIISKIDEKDLDLVR
jgi:hydrogenase expression/formation protein HypC